MHNIMGIKLAPRHSLSQCKRQQNPHRFVAFIGNLSEDLVDTGISR